MGRGKAGESPAPGGPRRRSRIVRRGLFFGRQQQEPVSLGDDSIWPVSPLPDPDTEGQSTVSDASQRQIEAAPPRSTELTVSTSEAAEVSEAATDAGEIVAGGDTRDREPEATQVPEDAMANVQPPTPTRKGSMSRLKSLLERTRSGSRSSSSSRNASFRSTSSRQSSDDKRSNLGLSSTFGGLSGSQGQVFEIKIHKADSLLPDTLLTSPVVRVSVVRCNDGTTAPANPTEVTSSSVPKPASGSVAMTSPVDVRNTSPQSPEWNETLLLNINSDSCLYNAAREERENQPSTSQHSALAGRSGYMLLVEILQPPTSFGHFRYRREEYSGGYHRIAWAFLKLRDGDMPRLSTLGHAKLQLFEYKSFEYIKFRRRNLRNRLSAYQSWCSLRKRRLWRWPRVAGTIDVTVESIAPLSRTTVIGERALLPNEEEVGRLDADAMLKEKISRVQESEELDAETGTTRYPRDPDEPCLIPNRADLRLDAGSLGCSALKFSKNGDFLAAALTGGTMNRVVVYSARTYACIATFTGHHEVVYDIAWSPSDSEFITASSDFTAKVWGMEGIDVKSRMSGPPIAPVCVLQHPCFVYSALYHPIATEPEAIIITGAYDKTLRLWNRKTGEPIFEMGGFGGCINTIAIDSLGKRIYVGDSTGAVMEFACKASAATGASDTKENPLRALRTCTELLGQPISSVKLHRSDRRLLVLTKRSMLVIIDLTMFTIDSRMSPPKCEVFPIKLEMSPDTKFAIAGSEDGRTLIWDLEASTVFTLRSINIHNETIVQFAWNPTEHTVAACSFGAALPICIFSYKDEMPRVLTVSNALESSRYRESLPTSERKKVILPPIQTSGRKPKQPLQSLQMTRSPIGRKGNLLLKLPDSTKGEALTPRLVHQMIHEAKQVEEQ